MANDRSSLEGLIGQSLAKAAAGFTTLDPEQDAIPNAETAADQIIEADAAGDDIAASQTEIDSTTRRRAKAFNFLSLDQRQVLPWPIAASAMAVANDTPASAQRKAQA